MDIGIVTDEIHKNPEKAFKIGTELGIKNYELRFLWDKRIPLITKEESNRLQELIREYEVNITALSPGIFKKSLYDSELQFHKQELLERTIEMGKKLGVKNIIIFGVKRSSKDKKGDFTRVLEYIKNVVERAAREEFAVFLENEPGWWADTARNTLIILQEIDNSHLKLNWDPGNHVLTEEKTYPEGYNMIKDYIGNVHFKDAREIHGGYEWVTADKGEVDWSDQLKALKRDDYKNMITIETHCKPLIKSTKKNLALLKQWLNSLEGGI